MLRGQTKTEREILILHVCQNANQLLVVLVGLLLKSGGLFPKSNELLLVLVGLLLKNIELLLKTVKLLLKSIELLVKSTELTPPGPGCLGDGS